MTRKGAATNLRSFRTFLLVQQFQAAEIGGRIAQARRENDGMTQGQLAELLNVSTRSLQDYERGETIPWKHFKRLEAIFGRELEWFLHGKTDDHDNLGELVAALELVDEKVERLLRALKFLLVQQVGAEAAEAALAIAQVEERSAAPRRRATA